LCVCVCVLMSALSTLWNKMPNTRNIHMNKICFLMIKLIHELMFDWTK